MIGSYNPDIYTEVDGRKMCVELQLSYINEKRRQKQVSDFVKAYPIHGAKTLLVFSDLDYSKASLPKGFETIVINTGQVSLSNVKSAR